MTYNRVTIPKRNTKEGIEFELFLKERERWYRLHKGEELNIIDYISIYLAGYPRIISIPVSIVIAIPVGIVLGIILGFCILIEKLDE